MSEQQDRTFMERVNAWGENANVMSQVSKQIGEFVGTAVDSGAELGSLVPVVEIVVTIGSFIGAGLGDTFGYEVLIGLVLAQIVALYLVAHYKGIAMATLGQASIYLAVVVGAVNTALAVYLALTSHDGTAVDPAIWQFPAYSSGAAILFFYVAKLFTHEAVANRRLLRVESENQIAEIKRAEKARREMNKSRDKMQGARLTMEADAMAALAQDERMKAIQKRAMYLTVVQDIMNQYEVKPSSKLGKQLLELANEAVNGGGEPNESDAYDDYDRSYADAVAMMLSALKDIYGGRFRHVRFQHVKDGGLFALKPGELFQRKGSYGVSTVGVERTFRDGQDVFVPMFDLDFLNPLVRGRSGSTNGNGNGSGH